MDNEIKTVESAEILTDTRPIRDIIYFVRGQQVLLDSDLAALLLNRIFSPRSCKQKPQIILTGTIKGIGISASRKSRLCQYLFSYL
ncbi:hypothetical protein [Sharpea porci]|uniref:hypothetical protein n=1 Tax=Sharpea porci TaxID=2652286 RepID=UPI002A90E47E|nr:hypothetical protein [Sharpea porci]MDY5278164.1 hypothetical protein [Sharpea porci]